VSPGAADDEAVEVALALHDEGQHLRHGPILVHRALDGRWAVRNLAQLDIGAMERDPVQDAFAPRLLRDGKPG